MALAGKSLILFGLQVTANNQWIDFKTSAMGVQISAQLTIGYYSLTQLLEEIERAMSVADPSNIYTASADRDIAGGTENRVTISTTGAFLSLLFGTGTHTATSAAALVGFPASDQTGDTEYTGTSSSGTVLIPVMKGYNYVDDDQRQDVFGVVNVAASGLKEGVVFSIQKFTSLEFKYEPKSRLAPDWLPFWQWAIQQRPFDFTPDYETDPDDFKSVTLESTPASGSGLGFEMMEMLPSFPNTYRTGIIKMRLTT